MTISDWIDKREMTGFPTFSYNDIRKALPALSAQVVSNELYRLGKQKRIQAVHKGFYTTVSIQFRDRGIVPPYNYVDQLMTHLGRPYYISLLSAGVLNGAAHQRPQRLSVTTVLPRIPVSKNSNRHLFWSYRKEIPQNLLLQTHTDTGTLLYSCPELTAVDLVQYSQQVGGLSAAATVIAELVENTDFMKSGKELTDITTFSTLQRLGYILENVLGEQSAADEISMMLEPYYKNLKYRPLSTDRPQDGARKNSKWKLIINQDIEPDELW
ncbi:type IV toxin-antitoxin system AbiEi family antitoxin domain-containing protein [Bacteroides gallinarum]|uniref:type IV toxin-antitoxin system AbiEi family antitoxin domain-containing protein n=1 Tax=Bacteroides gallinarum TaxID=376806 RepID=UPI000469790C|nr:type IV toxin-antitoxin system AbiEi family antitoxin [Bacteroides gallinarum]